MATKVNDVRNALSQVLFENLATRTETQSVGFMEVTITNMDNASVPQVAATSRLEAAGAIYIVESNESITGSPADGTVYIKIVPGTTSATFAFTNTAPTWADDKQGWYSPTIGEENQRYLDFQIDKSGVSYYKKSGIIEKKITRISAHLTTNITASLVSPIIYDTVLYDEKAEYNNTTGIITIQASGWYIGHASSWIDNNLTGSFSSYMRLYKNSVEHRRGYDNGIYASSATGSLGNNISFYDYFNSGDQLYFSVTTGSSSNTLRGVGVGLSTIFYIKGE